MSMESTLIPIDAFEARDADGQHEITCIAVPYGKITHKAAISMKGEMFAPGSMASAVAHPDKIRLRSHDHSLDKHLPVGVASELQDRPEGLWARFRLYNTPEGRAAYEHVKEGVYGGVSVGFVAVKERVVDGIREILEGLTHHVSLAEEPAYDEAALLSLRASHTPDLSAWEKYARPPEVDLSMAASMSLTAQLRQMMRAG